MLGMAVLKGALSAVIVLALLLPSAPDVSGASTGIIATMSNGAKANKVLLWSRGANGSLTFIGKTATGGKGNGKALGNQGGLTLSADGGWLYVVNPGSDSVTVFRVNGTTLTRTDVEPTRGDKPISVTVHGDLVYVLNAGGSGNIRGFRRDTNGRLTLIEASKRPLSGSNNRFQPRRRLCLRDRTGHRPTHALRHLRERWRRRAAVDRLGRP
jgi:6-phosphogluconolactonase